MINKKKIAAKRDSNSSGLFLKSTAGRKSSFGNNYAESDIIRLATFFRSNPNPILVFSPEGDIIKTNPAAERCLKRLHIEQEELLPADHQKIVQACLDGRLKEYSIEVRIKNCIFALTYHPLPSFKLVYLYAIEISEYQQTEAVVLQIAESQLNLVKLEVLNLQPCIRSRPQWQDWRSFLFGSLTCDRNQHPEIFVAMDGCIFSEVNIAT